MDCGPAALASLLNGYGLSVSYPRLRELCQTDVDGTSIDTLEVLASRLGLEAEQVMVPNDFVLRQTTPNLPAIAVVTLPNGLTHFVVIWRERFGYVQIMDPARGRSWIRKDRLLDSLYQHRVEVDAEDWLDYARSDEFSASLKEGLEALGVDGTTAGRLLGDACAASDWQPLARLDAAIRMCRSLRAAGAKIRPADIPTLLAKLPEQPDLIPDRHFQVQAADDPQQLTLTAAILLRVRGVASARGDTSAGGDTGGGGDTSARGDMRGGPDPLLARTREPAQPTTTRRLAGLLGELNMNGMVGGLAGVSLLVGAITFIEALVFRYLIGAQPPSDLIMLGMTTFVAIAPLAAAVALEAGSIRMSQALGRQLDTRLRAMLLHKLPRIADGYFSSRLISDLAERGHAITQVRELPELARRIVVAVTRITLILAGLVWLLPQQLALILFAAVVALAAPLALYPTLAERDMRARTHVGALSRFYLDSLRGSEAIWAHDAARSMTHEHESLLLKWAQAAREFQRPAIVFELAQVLGLAAISIFLVFAALSEPGTSVTNGTPLGSILLVAYWSLFIPILSRQLTETLKQIPSVSNVARRVFELLDAPEEDVETSLAPTPTTGTSAVGIEFRSMTIARGELELLSEISVRIEPGERVAIVGASGSGKSTLLGTILGWHPATAGTLLIDGAAASAGSIASLREQAVMIDPDLYLWNKSLFDSISYGCGDLDPQDFEVALSGSEMLADLQQMNEGLATLVGENGSRLSGGESQRLRIARGLLRADRRLVLLDEPFTGMDSAQRARLRDAVLARWPAATLLWVSHNVSETTGFDRVLVLAGGRIVEDGAPAALLARDDSGYAEMIATEHALQQRLTEGGDWLRRVFQHGEVHLQ